MTKRKWIFPANKYKHAFKLDVLLLERLIVIITIFMVFLMLLSLKYRFLDKFVPGSWHGRIGGDFYTTPNAFLNYVKYGDIYKGEHLYGPYSENLNFIYHPIVALLLGSWLSIFQPLTAYWIFVSISVVILIGCASILSSYFNNSLLKKIVFFIFLCPPCTYLMLWNAQIHILVVLSITLVLSSLFDLQFGKKSNAKLFVGLFLSLIIKPIAVMFIPLFLFLKSYRKTTILTVLTFIVLTFCFQNKFLYFGNYLSVWQTVNAYASGINHNNIEFFSFPCFVNQLFDINIPLNYYKSFLIFIFYHIPLLIFIRKEYKVIFALLLFYEIIICFYTSYPRVWEYNYTNMLPVIVGIIFLLYRCKDFFSKFELILLKLSIGISSLLYMPVLHFIFRENPGNYLAICRLPRIIPIVFLFFSLLIIIEMFVFRYFEKPNINLIRSRDMSYIR